MMCKRTRRVPTFTNGRMNPPKRGLFIRSLESGRLTGLRSMPVEERAAAVREFLRRAR